MNEAIGRIAAVWTYPVNGCGGVALTEAVLERGEKPVAMERFRPNVVPVLSGGAPVLLRGGEAVRLA